MKWYRPILVSLIISLCFGLPLSSFSAFANVVKSDKQPPQAPTALTSPAKTTTSISLSWKDSVDNFGIDRYHIYRMASKWAKSVLVRSIRIRV